MKILNLREERNIEELKTDETAGELSIPFIKDLQEGPFKGLLNPTRLS
jgi:hypothetical protein